MQLNGRLAERPCWCSNMPIQRTVPRSRRQQCWLPFQRLRAAASSSSGPCLEAQHVLRADNRVRNAHFDRFATSRPSPGRAPHCVIHVTKRCVSSARRMPRRSRQARVIIIHTRAVQAPGDERSQTAQQRAQPQPQPSNRRPPEPEEGWLDRLVDWLMPQERVRAYRPPPTPRWVPIIQSWTSFHCEADHATKGESWKLRDLWSAFVEWSRHEMQEWSTGECMQSSAATSDGHPPVGSCCAGIRRQFHLHCIQKCTTKTPCCACRVTPGTWRPWRCLSACSCGSACT